MATQGGVTARSLELEGRVAVVTGAAQGIGRAEALALAAAGASVIVNNREGASVGAAKEVVEQIRSTGGAAELNTDDVASWSGGERVVGQALERFGRLDILVNNAGIARDRTTVRLSEEEWDETLRVNVKGHLVPSKFAAIYWREESHKAGGPVYGRIINTTSQAGMFGSAGQVAYSAAKGAVMSLTFTLAVELARYGVTCNAIAPRARTRMTEVLPAFNAMKDDDQAGLWAPENVAPLLVWLASEPGAAATGSLFVTFGDRILLVDPPRIVASVTAVRGEPSDELGARMKTVFGGEVRQGPLGPLENDELVWWGTKP